MRRFYLFSLMLLTAGSICAESLQVIYMAQAGYDPGDVQKRGEEFTAKTGIEVEFRFEEYEDIYAIVTGDEGQNGAFDIVLLDNIWTADFAARGILDPVPDRLRKTVENGIIPEIYSANIYRGKMWGIPFLANFQLLYTNMDMLRMAGYSRPPVTLQEMLEMARAAKDRGIIEHPFFDSLRPEEVLICELVWLSGALGNPWQQQPGRLVIDRPENRRAVEYLLQMKREGLLNPYSLQSGEVFAADVFQYGDAMFTTNWTFLIGRLSGDEAGGIYPQFEWKLSVLPTQNYGQQSSTVSGFQGLAVMKNSDNKTAAWDFITFLSSPDFQQKFLDEFPVWMALWSDRESGDSDPYFGVKKQQVEGAKVRPVIPDYQQVSAIIIKWVWAALNESIDTDSAFISLQNEIDGLGVR